MNPQHSPVRPKDESTDIDPKTMELYDYINSLDKPNEPKPKTPAFGSGVLKQPTTEAEPAERDAPMNIGHKIELIHSAPAPMMDPTISSGKERVTRIYRWTAVGQTEDTNKVKEGENEQTPDFLKAFELKWGGGRGTIRKRSTNKAKGSSSKRAVPTGEKK